ncbi:MAG: hypothetical protein ACRDOE_00505 [Streptosporangiaceae bacterium]
MTYVLVRGGTQLGDKVLRRRFRVSVSLKASAGEARDIARPLARMVARRVDWSGDTSDAMDGLFLLFALAGFIAERTGIELDNLQGDPGWDAELHNQIESEVRATRRRQRRPTRPVGEDEAQPPGFEPAPPPAAPMAPQAPPAGAGDVPVLLADRLIESTRRAEEQAGGA